MAGVDADAAPAALVIRGAPGRCAGLASGLLAFVVVGLLMLTVPPPAGWSPVLAGLGGVLAFLLGLAGLGITAYVATRPILLVYADRLVDVRRSLTIPFAEIRAVVAVPLTGGALTRWLSPQWLLLHMHDAAQYAALERLSKRWGFTSADLTLDLSLASAADFKRAQQFIADHLVVEAA